MNRFAKIFLLSFLLLQVFSYLHLEEHGHEGEHEHHDEECQIVFHLNHFSADDSFDLDSSLPEFVSGNHFVPLLESQIYIFINQSYLTRASPHIS
jgi:hypothetical protein